MRWSFASPHAERSGPWTPGLSRRSRRFIALLTAVIFTLAFLAGFVRAAPVDQDKVIVPNATLPKSSAGAGGATSTAFTFVAVLALASGGAWLLWRNRKGGPTPGRRLIRQLAIEETRSLGSRQYLVVASYQDKKFLLGVCPGRIDLLAPLSAADEPSPEKVRL